MQKDEEDVAIFLLETPPLEEIGGLVANIVETYRFGNLTKKQAIEEILTNHKKYISKYITDQNIIFNQITK